MDAKQLDIRDLPEPPAGKAGWPWTEGRPPLPEKTPDGRTWPSITVITPSYNQGRFIEETIRSILLQRYPNLEYLIIDGGSTDESVGVIRKYEPWITYWVSERDRGQAHAINKGLARATGDIFNWINSDDVLTPDALATVGGAFSDCDMVAGGNTFLYPDGSEQRRFCKGLTASGLLRRETSTEMHQMAMWVRTAGALACGGMDESMHYAFDPDYYLRYMHDYPRVRYVDVNLGWFRKHDEAKTVAGRGHYIPERLQTIEKIRADEHYTDLWADADYVARRYEWWLRLAEIVNQPRRGSWTRAAEILLNMSADRAIRSDKITRRALRNLLRRREIRPYVAAI